MHRFTLRKCAALVTFLVLMLFTSVPGSQSTVYAQELPDLVPDGLAQWAVTNRLGVPTLEFGILTSNIGGQDFWRPRDPDNPSVWLLRQIYEYVLYVEEGGEWVEIDRRRKNTICTIDDPNRGNRYPCIQEHGRMFGCGQTQGVSRGWADDYFRGLTGQWSRIGDSTGRFLLETLLDPDYDLQRKDIPDRSRDGNPDNNWAWAIFNWDGANFSVEEEIYSFVDPCAGGGLGNCNR